MLLLILLFVEDDFAVVADVKRHTLFPQAFYLFGIMTMMTRFALLLAGLDVFARALSSVRLHGFQEIVLKSVQDINTYNNDSWNKEPGYLSAIVCQEKYGDAHHAGHNT